MSDLKKFEEKRKESLLQTIGNTFWLGLEDLAHTMGFGKKESTPNGDQISRDLDNYEQRLIKKSK